MDPEEGGWVLFDLLPSRTECPVDRVLVPSSVSCPLHDFETRVGCVSVRPLPGAERGGR